MFGAKCILGSKIIKARALLSNWGSSLVKCPKCGSIVTVPVKTRPVSSTKLGERDEQSRLIMGIFRCSKCKAQFRTVVKSEAEAEGRASIKNLVEKIKDIKGELMQTLKTLREKIKTLETERVNLMVEIEKLKKVAESRANTLENEVAMLREDLKSLKELLGHAEEREM